MNNAVWHTALGDELNAEIWEQSPNVQRSIQQPCELEHVGAVGAQQAMLEDDMAPGVSRDTIVPWVPDLVGPGWRESDALLVVGSAYAGFIKELCSRGRSLPLADYISAESADEFQRSFVEHVVKPDSSYYGPLAKLIDGAAHPHRWALLDLCRASFVRRRTVIFVRRGIQRSRRWDESKDLVPRQAHQIFNQYVESERPAEWIWRRIADGNTKRIVALGQIAEHGLLRLFYRHNMVIQASDGAARWSPTVPIGMHEGLRSTLWPARYADPNRHVGDWVTSRTWWTVRGNIAGNPRSWNILPVVHPARALPSTYPKAAELLREMLST